MSIRFFPDGLYLELKCEKQHRYKQKSRNWKVPIPGILFVSALFFVFHSPFKAIREKSD